MRRILFVSALFIVLNVSNSCSNNAYQNFMVDKNKYELKKVVVLSRHNIRSPLSGNGSLTSQITNHEWFHWTSQPSELSTKGALLENLMGCYFRDYLIDYGLLEDSYIPSPEDETFYFFANSLQRTIATAQHFSNGMFKIPNVKINHKYNDYQMDEDVAPVTTYLSNSYIDELNKEMNENIDFNTLEDSYRVISDVLDYSESTYARTTLPAFVLNDTELNFEVGEEPYLTENNSLNIAKVAADALSLQYYEEVDDNKAAFGHSISYDDWRKIGKVLGVYGILVFGLPSLSINIAHPMLIKIKGELDNYSHKFSYLCGHDANITSILPALHFNQYSLPYSIEDVSPIGGKVMIEEWLDKTSYEKYYSFTFVYAKTEQIRAKTALNLTNSPVRYHLTINGLDENNDGLYKYDDIQNRFTSQINAYDDLATLYPK